MHISRSLAILSIVSAVDTNTTKYASQTWSTVSGSPSVVPLSYKPPPDEPNLGDVTWVIKNLTVDTQTFNIPLSYETTNAWALCWYPLSGFYSRLLRVLFYATLLFSLVAINFPWLVIGALASGMTYAGAVAIHAIVMTWSRQATANLDFGAAFGILAFSAALVVPLLNWSKTIRELGRSQGEDAAGRTIILYWAFLIFIALFSQIIGLWIAAGPHQDLNRTVFVYSNTSHVTCSPPGGVLDLDAGQNTAHEFLFMSKEFVEKNNCHNPCMKPINHAVVPIYASFRGIEGWHANKFAQPAYAITRDIEQLKPVTERGIQHFFYPDRALLPERSEVGLTLLSAYLVGGTIVLGILMLQGILTAAFGRREPLQIRNIIYLSLRPTNHNRILARSQRIFARLAGWAFQIFAVIASMISILLIPLTIAITEYAMYEFEQSDADKVIDAWAPWASTVLVLFSAVLYRFQNILQRKMWRIMGREQPQRPPPRVFRATTLSSTQSIKLADRSRQKPDSDSSGLSSLFRHPVQYVHYGWVSIVEFWKDPDTVAEKNKGRWGLQNKGTDRTRDEKFQAVDSAVI